MSLKPHIIPPVPEETARVARAAFPHGSPYLTVRDALGPIFQDEDFAALFPVSGQPGLPPGVSPWSRSYSFVNSCLTAKRRKRSAHGLLGSLNLASSETIPGAMFPLYTPKYPVPLADPMPPGSGLYGFCSVANP